MDEPTIRTATPSDAGAVSELLLEFNGEALSPDELAERMVQAVGLETVFLGQLEGRLAGLAVLRTIPTLSAPEDWAELTELYVRPPDRRRGVGKALVGAAIQYAHSRGCTQVHLLVDPENRAALSFYTAVGFHRDSWEMRRQI
jgi:ribosomal protein S18 acetylase RimI-like enzyme